MTYAWTQTQGGDVTLSSTTAAAPTFTAPALEDELEFSLTVTDAGTPPQTSTAATVTITVTPPGTFRIALEADTGFPNDRITSNGQVNVMNPGGMWRYTTNGGTTFSDIQPEATTSFTLKEGVYGANDVVANQVGEGTESILLGAVTVDTTAPTVVTFVTTIAPGVVGTPQPHTITFSEGVSFVSAAGITPTGATLDSVTSSNEGITYTITFTPNMPAFSLTLAIANVVDAAGNTGAGEMIASGTATPALAFDTAPALTTNNADPQRAKDGDILTLTFTVNQALASVPVVVTIAGQPITPTGTAGNVYTATYTVVAAEVTDEGAVVSYSTGRLTAAGPADNTAQITDDSAIRIDLSAPTITLTGGDAPVVLTVGGTYTEPGATATDNVDASVPTPTPSGTVDTDTAGEYTITYTATDRAGNVATKARTVIVSVATATRPVVVTPASPITFAEGATGTVATFTATPSTGRTIASWAVGGADRGDFSITTHSTTNAGILTFNTRPDFETKSAYSITVIATDSGGEASEALAVTVTVTNVDEDGAAFIDGAAQAGQVLTARVTDPDAVTADNPDGTVAVHIFHTWRDGTDDRTLASKDANDKTFRRLRAGDIGNTIYVVVRYSDPVHGGNTKSVTSLPTAAVIASSATPAPGIALAMDTGSSASDGITSNGVVNVPLASDFETETDSPDSWDYSTNGGGSYTVGTNPTPDPLASSFTASFDLGSLDDGTYQLRVRQTIGGTRSAPASLQVTLDRTAPTVTFGDITAVIDKEQTHPIIFSEAVDFVSADITAAGATVNSVALDSGSDRAYTITFTPNMADFSLTLAADSVMDIAGNDGPATEARTIGTETVASTPSTPPPAPANRNPVAEAGPAQSVVTDMPVTLSGSGNDPDGDNNALTYSWELTGGTGITLSNANIAGPTFTPTAAGVYTFTLTVTDDGGADSAADTVTITVTVPANRPPVAEAGPAQRVVTNALVTLRGSGNDPDGDNNALTYSWELTGGTGITLSNADTAGPTFTPVAAGTYTFTLTVTDDADAPASDTDTVSITVTRSLSGLTRAKQE